MSEEIQTTQDAPIAGIGTMVFGQWDASDITCSDPGLAPYINLTTIGPHTVVADMLILGLAKQNYQLLRDSLTI